MMIREKNRREDFHTTKFFVLVCTTGPAFFELRRNFETATRKQAHSAV